MKRVNRKRRASKYDRNYGLDGRRGEAVRQMPCIIAGRAGHRCNTTVQACHDRARGMGGCNGGARDLFPGCDLAHQQAGARGTEQREGFERVHMLSIVEICERIALHLDAVLGPEPCYRCGEVDAHSPLCPTVEAREERRRAG